LYIGTSAYPTGVDVKADMIYLYCEMFYNSFQVITVVGDLSFYSNETKQNALCNIDIDK
jgi:hypothetical protein